MSYYQFTDDQGKGYGSCEIFYVDKYDALSCRKELWDKFHLPLEESIEEANINGGTVTCFPGWYWQACLPGCLPDGSAMGPFETEEEAMQDAEVLQ